MTRAALVLGAAVWAGGVPSPALARRACHAAALWRAEKVDVIVACGGLGHHPPAEAEAIAAVLHTEGVPRDAIRLESASRSTRDNIARALPILRALGATRVVIVTDPWHAPRARLIARQAGLAAGTDSPPWCLRPALVRALLREAAALFAAVLRWR
jgi:uncharacterized SAM-binding protein YcdF (DUF218 family)